MYLTATCAYLCQNTTHCSLNENGDIDRDALCLTDEIFLPAMARLDKLGKTIKVHCAGTGSIRYAVNAIETLRKNSAQSMDYGSNYVLKHSVTLEQIPADPATSWLIATMFIHVRQAPISLCVWSISDCLIG